MRLRWGNSDPGSYMFAKTELVNLLVSEDVDAQTEARHRLGITEEDELLPFLTDCLTHHDDELRSAAGRALAHLGDDTVLFHFVAALDDPDFRVRAKAKRAILAFEDSRPLVRHIQSYLRQGIGRGQPVRIASIEALKELGDERAAPFLIGALYDPDRNVRAAAAESLGSFAGERVVRALLWALERDESPRVVRAAGRALGRIGGDLTFEALTEMMGYLDAESYIAAVRALGEIGDRRAIPHIVEMLPDQPYGAMRASGRTLKALDGGNLGAESLSDLESADDYQKACAALVLGLLGDQRAFAPLERTLKDSEGCVAATAARALGWLGDERAFQPLADALSRSDPKVRGAAVDALERLGDIRASEVLESFIDDKENARLHPQARRALRRLRGSK